MMADEKGLTELNLDFCKNLRTKRYYISDDPPATYLAEEVATTGYWCLRTMGPFGPDDGTACPETCGAHRSCYQSSVARPA
jgi:hypothetical protein